jgi:hypothetical protein
MAYIANSFSAREHVLHRHIVPQSLIALCIADVVSSAARRVTVGRGRERWAEHSIEAGSALGRFLHGDNIHALVETATQLSLKRPPSIWAQVYEVGERIAWHRDSLGVAQLLICLEQPSENCGGAFLLKSDGHTQRIDLAAGDGLIFEATRTPHCTTRLSPCDGSPAPRRITAVARFF